MPFGNPGNTVDIANTVALDAGSISGIGVAGLNSGSRLVDPFARQAIGSGNLALNANSANIDMGGAVSFFLRLDPTNNVIQTGVELNLLWLDGNGTLITSRVYEFNAAGGCTIQDRCLGSICIITYHANYGAGVPGNLKYTMYGSSRPVDTNRILGEGGDTGNAFGFDGTLLATSGTLAGGASSPRAFGAVSNGRAILRMGLGTPSTVGPLRIRIFHGVNPVAIGYTFILPVAALTNGDVFQELILPPRPLVCDVSNLGGSGSMIYGVTIWTDPNSHV